MHDGGLEVVGVLNDLGSLNHERLGNGQTLRQRAPAVDRQVELRLLLDRQGGWLHPVQNTGDVTRKDVCPLPEAAIEAHEASCSDPANVRVDCGQVVSADGVQELCP